MQFIIYVVTQTPVSMSIRVYLKRISKSRFSFRHFIICSISWGKSIGIFRLLISTLPIKAKEVGKS